VLVHEAVAAEFLPQLGALMASRQVELRAEGAALQILQANGAVATLAGPEDFDTEWMALILGIKVVRGLAEAVEHIYAHGSEHSDGILTNDLANATAFVNALSSSAVFVNASTRFNDGGQFGLGAEVAVSTQKLHARGPMGLEELTTYKWVAVGDYHIRP
jgi:glutamate-5-semialdehyde dehydrogenase